MTEESVLLATQVADYTVCPEAYRLKYVAAEGPIKKHSTTKSTATEIKKEWSRKQDLRNQFLQYSKILMLLLVALLLAVYFLDKQELLTRGSTLGEFPLSNSIRSVPVEIALLLLILASLIFLWDLFYRRSAKLGKESGISEEATVLAAKGSNSLEAKTLFSKKWGLKSEPHAMLKENGLEIPLDIHPSTNKVRDRHVLPLLVSLHILEETTGKRPPYGILLMGKNKRRVEIKYSDEKARWLVSILKEMRSIIAGTPALPLPSERKCKNCDVRSLCSSSAI